MTPPTAYFAFFVVSGFAGLVYQIVWLRLAMAHLGVTTTLVSTVLSVFMAGLALGSWAGGALARSAGRRGAAHALRLYAATETAIALTALAVPLELAWGRELLARAAATASWSSPGYHAASAACVAIALSPACIAMGACFPLAMAALRGEGAPRGDESFSHLYLANVLGAAAGTLGSAFVLIELLGFRRTLLVAVALNLALAVVAFTRSARLPHRPDAAAVEVARAAPPPRRPLALGCLFLTGLASLGMEVVWIRQFAPYVGTLVYAFAAILATYLLATFAGSRAYRAWARDDADASAWPWIALAAATVLPLLTADPRLPLPDLARVVAGIAPFCAFAGFVTPMLVDRWSRGEPRRAGAAYAVNVVGSILGPLVAGFALLPTVGERAALVALAAPLVGVAVLVTAWPAALVPGAGAASGTARAALAAAIGVTLVLATGTKGWESTVDAAEVRRDHTATVVARGSGFGKELLINGQPATVLGTIPKMMAHLPLASLDRAPRDAVVICFGMGTTFRSALSWGIDTTAVELVPSVPALFPYFHADAGRVLASPRARIVIDDGRRFLERSSAAWDVITLDPPFPIEAAGSSLLYTREFYTTARARLRPGGILQQWFPTGELKIVGATVRALREAFPVVRVFPILQGTPPELLGFHFLASDAPIRRRGPAELADRLPPAAAADIVEWKPGWSPARQVETTVRSEIPVDALLALAAGAPTLEDDRPFNEYFLLRRYAFLLTAPAPPPGAVVPVSR